MGQFFFNSWESLLRILIVGVLAYVGLVLFLRISGKRTLSKMNAFDFVVTIALGSILATVIVSRDVSLADGLTALALLIGLQFLVTWSSVRWRAVTQLVTGEPALLFFRGRFLDRSLLRSRVTRDEVLAAVRSAGVHDAGEVEAVVLETDGSLSVVSTAERIARSSLESVRKSSNGEPLDEK